MDFVTLIVVIGVLSIAGITTIGGVAALLKQKVVVDDNGQVTDIEIPLLGRFRSNYPSLVALVLGIILAYTALHKITLQPETMQIQAAVEVQPSDIAANPQVFVGVIPQKYHSS